MLLEEVIITVFKGPAPRPPHPAVARWQSTDIDVDLPRQKLAIVRTDEGTIALVRRLAAYYPDAVIAGILNRQDRCTAYGHRFTANHVGSLRRQWNILRFEPPATLPEGELLTVKQAAAVLGTATANIHRWLNDGSIGGEQLTPGAPASSAAARSVLPSRRGRGKPCAAILVRRYGTTCFSRTS